MTGKNYQSSVGKVTILVNLDISQTHLPCAVFELTISKLKC